MFKVGDEVFNSITQTVGVTTKIENDFLFYVTSEGREFFARPHSFVKVKPNVEVDSERRRVLNYYFWRDINLFNKLNSFIK